MNRFNDVFEYRDGELYWKSGRLAGNKAGSKHHKGYFTVWTKGKSHNRARVIWEMHKGPIPSGLEIDHINRERGDDRIENLRLATRAQNCINKSKKPSNSKYRGITFNKDHGKWQVQLGRTNRHGGFFDCEHDAALAYNNMAFAKYGEFAVLNEVTYV